ncbi:MAG: hypothetical protein AMJ53_18680 [Gammaproteobacteria bacterium SG8_11]|nr:MAG: hypothetical protein AMJ53_18680 [Gammaproteobacteria bacterium SG8_11]
MARAQGGTPRGFYAATRFDIGSNTLTANSTAVLFDAGIQISGARYITADSTGYVLTTESSLPGNVDGGAQFTMISNSTGVALAICTTGTTWQYIATTSVQPT